MYSLSELISKNKKLLAENKTAFRQIFNTPLEDYFDLITGFDIVDFDEKHIKSINDESMEAVVLAAYGERGVDMIRLLLA